MFLGATSDKEKGIQLYACYGASLLCQVCGPAADNLGDINGTEQLFWELFPSQHHGQFGKKVPDCPTQPPYPPSHPGRIVPNTIECSRVL